MKYKREEMFDLNEENVKNIFKYCLASVQTPKELVGSYSFLAENCQTDIPKMHFNKTKLAEMRNAINYMLGQLQSIHNNELVMYFHEGFRKYTDENWTVNRMALFSLCYLGVATSQLPQFEPSSTKEGAFESPIHTQTSLMPTVSPNDKKFEKWLLSENEKIEWQANIQNFIEDNKKIFNSYSYKELKEKFYKETKEYFGEQVVEDIKEKDAQLESFLTGEQLKKLTKAEIQSSVDKITNQKPFKATLLITKESNDKNYKDWLLERELEMFWKADLPKLKENFKHKYSSQKAQKEIEDYCKSMEVIGHAFAEEIKRSIEELQIFFTKSKMIDHLTRKEAIELAIGLAKSELGNEMIKTFFNGKF